MTSTETDRRNAQVDGSIVDGHIRAAQISALVQFAPLTMLVNAINAILIAVIVAPVASWFALAPWLGIILTIAFMGMRAWFKGRRSIRRTASRRAIRRATINASVLALLWAFVPIAWFPHVEPFGKIVIATVVTGMICAGGFALSTVRPAAYAYVTILTAGAVTGLMTSQIRYQAVMLMLLTVYGLVVLRSVQGHAKLFTDHFLAEATLKERGQVIELLLAEFEENGSDWLFQIDDQSRIVHCSQRFVDVTGRTEDEILGMPLEFFISLGSREQLSEALDKNEPFRQLVVEAAAKPGQSWWSLTAKPIFDDTGRCTGWRGVGSDITTEKSARDHVQWMANTDVLTGAANRASFVDAVGRALTDAAQSGAKPLLCSIDIDHFKAINDTFGHPAGDAMLKAVADALLKLADGHVKVGRLGGDEFAALFARPDPAQSLESVATTLAQHITAHHVVDGLSVPLRVSIGIAQADTAGETVDGLMVKADLALYRAKQEGRNRVSVYDEALHRQIQEQRALREELEHAIRNGEFEVFYQPIVDLRSHRTVCCEALVRWRHPERGMIAPSVFIPLAESTGLINDIGRFVVRRATQDATAWPESVRLAVNISPAQIGRATLLSDVVGALADSRLAPSRLELEITEAVFLRDEFAAIRFVEQIKALGVRLALDDFGTGFSSLGYIARYPIDKIKIDRSFISGTAPIRNREAIVASIVKLARDLDFTTTAEGVESPEEAAWIAQLGCEQAQGYLFAQPMPANKLLAFISGDGVARAAARSSVG